MYNIFLILSLIVAILLIIVVLLQASKGHGLAGSAFGGASTAVLGVRRTADFLQKTTIYLAVILGALCILSNFFIPRADVVDQDAFIDRGSQTAPAQPQPTIPTE